MDFGWCVDGETVNLSLSLCDTKEVEKNKRRFTFIFEFLQLFRLLIKIHWATLSNLSKKMFVFHIFIFWFSKEKKKKFRRNISKTWKQKFGRTRISHLFFFSNTYKNRVRQLLYINMYSRWHVLKNEKIFPFKRIFFPYKKNKKKKSSGSQSKTRKTC